MKLSHLKTFLKVAETGSFTKAAQELYTTQPTVTHHIQALEQALGYQLIVRSSSNTRLTASGKQLLLKAGELFRLIDDIKGASATQEQGVQGALNIAASSVMGAHYLPPVLKVILDTYPHIDIHLHFGTAYSIATWVQDGFVDLGFAPKAPGFSRLQFTPLLAEPCILAISSSRYAEHSAALEGGDCANQPFILREKGTIAHEYAMRWLKKQPWFMDMRAPTILSDMESIKNLVMEHAGMTIIPRCCVQQPMDQGLIREVKSDISPGKINYFMIERANEPECRTVSILKRLLTEIKGV
ncbi:LysR family transcriptional regulator [Fundidesulfovibrio agrisoli]|uniref:LysR family transcriptional regulator n=1 Tax=Fundidesulfovibrio agrisoli TaxID=2922717 RepID=UPI001FAE63CF|nr:LysR family transcriptional regulator [Fundidesulfovibrio agrisoli]